MILPVQLTKNQMEYLYNLKPILETYFSNLYIAKNNASNKLVDLSTIKEFHHLKNTELLYQEIENQITLNSERKEGPKLDS